MNRSKHCCMGNGILKSFEAMTQHATGWCMIALLMAISTVRAEDLQKSGNDRSSQPQVTARGREIAILSSTETPSFFPIARGTIFEEAVVSPDGTMALHSGPQPGAASERTIYSNTLGRVVVAMPANQLIADDITTTAPDGCALTRFTFQTVGKADPNGTGGPYTVSYALYQFCPGAVSQGNRPSLIIPGTNGTVDFFDDGFHTTTVVFPPNVSAPTNFYLGLVANRANVGVMMGAPPLIGLSCDVFDYPALACGATLGGFPDQPHASFNAEFFATNSCPASFVSYRNDNPKQSAFLIGPDHPFFDDIHLNTDNCQMIAYEVMVKGSGFYSFDLTGSCGGAVVPGTHRDAAIAATPGIPNKLRFTFDPPVQIPRDLWISATAGPLSGIIMTGKQACTGSTADLLCEVNSSGIPEIISPPDSLQEGFDVTITCAGTPPVGACCDMYDLDNNGDAVCREVPQMNCPFPPVGNDIAQPKWMQGAACDSSPFPQPCGVAACCGFFERTNPSNPSGPHIFQEDCENHSKNQCDAQHPIPLFCVGGTYGGLPCQTNSDCPGSTCSVTQYPNGAPSLWQRGLYCGLQGQSCPRVACLQRNGDCHASQPGSFGCSDAFCCDCVCQNFGAIGEYCCEVEWDDTCVALTGISPCGPPGGDCARLSPSWDSCSSTHPGNGAHLISVPGTFNADLRNATNETSDPEFCCHTGFQQTCIGGPFDGLNCTSTTNCCDNECGTCANFHCVGGPNDQAACVSDSDCCGAVCGICPNRMPEPANGVGSGWFKFVVPQNQTSISISTCRSSTPANDSLIQIFDCTDHTDEASCCASLVTIGCNDDAQGCGNAGTNSRLCVSGLTPGRTYYGMVSAKTEADRGQYIIDITTPCSVQSPVPNDFCTYPKIVSDGVTPFNLAGATPDCPQETQLPSMVNDIWFNYTATCNGMVIIQTCGAGPIASPDTNMAVYPNCISCPPYLPIPVGVSDFAGGSCYAASKVTINNVTHGLCYRIRLGDANGNPVSGNLTIACQALCLPGAPCCGSAPCDDGNPCTDDECDPQNGCLHINNAEGCDDGSACTVNDMCLGGICTGTPINCDDGNSCTTDTCNPDTGCVHQNNCGSCCDQRDGACTDSVLAGGCTCSQCVWNAGGSCAANQCQRQFIPIPTVSTWGAAILSLILLVGMKIQFGRKRSQLSRAN
ncbi:MAG: hypothetical protein HY287_16210 [Planctomycetes bacterium]|nr:hypothetical protein [Planctomycetota bacterium]MBI3835870.1 hypothetical protein [Planctomycetota bacterium]